MNRDEETGRIKINGKLGAFLDWLRYLLPVAIIPLALGYVRLEVFHARVDDFMEAGPRFSGTKEINNSTALKLDILSLVDEKMDALPPPLYVNQVDMRFSQIEAQLAGQRRLLEQILREIE